MDKPQIGPAAVGLAWRPRRNGWAAVWLARIKGFRPSTHQIGVYTSELTDEQITGIVETCSRLQQEMYGIKKQADLAGTVRALINSYQTDPDSSYHDARYQSRRGFDFHLRHIDKAYGDLKLADLNARKFKQWYEAARWPDGRDGRDKVSTAHGMITVVRLILRFGAAFEIEPNCARLKAILSDMTFEKGKPRTEALTLRQCEDIIAGAHAKGLHSIALAQAIQWDLRARQKDAIGEWVPMSEPGISTTVYHRRKWLRGLRWDEISSTMLLQHPASKTGKIIERDLTLYPMIKAEIDKIPAEARSGPVVICELTGRPWAQNHFRVKWREIADAVGVPASVFNMDSRAGGITETIEATDGNLEAARKEADHSDQAMTARYSRRKKESNAETAARVLDFRAKNRG